MKRKAAVLIGSVLALLVLNSVAKAVPTEITVRVISKGAKFVGTSMGGALVVIEDATTGAVLAEGRTDGATGNTQMIMKTPRVPGKTVISDEESAKFTASVDIDRPTYVEISAYGPLAQRQSANRVSLTQWILPGKHITQGDALMLELPGFVVDVLEPPAHGYAGSAPARVAIRANIRMMCGCPLTPGGLWDSNQFELRAMIEKGGEKVEKIDMRYAGEPSRFRAEYHATEPGVYQVTVYAFDPANGNTGLDHTTFIMR